MSIPSDLIDRVTQGSVVLFLGAGATRDAGGPTGSELAELLGTTFGRSDIPTDSLQTFSDILCELPDIDREDIDAAIIRSLRDLSPCDAHYSLPMFCWRAILTTNYDRLIERAYENAKTKNGEPSLQTLQVIVGSKDYPSFVDHSNLPVLKLHGCISHVTAGCPLVLSSADYERTAKHRSKMLRTLRSLAKELTVLFIGYSFPDGSIQQMLRSIERESPYDTHRKMYAVLPDPPKSVVDYFSNQRIDCIDASFGSFFEQLGQHVEREAAKACLARRLSPVRLPGGQHYSIPPKLRVALEPQVEQITPETYPRDDAEPFFRGCLPRVGDLRAGNDVGRACATKLTTTVQTALTSEAYLRPVVAVLGAGGSGKSTLALRTAYDLAANGDTIAFRLKSHENWDRQQLAQLAQAVTIPTIFVIENLELRACMNAVKELRIELSNSRCRTLLLLSCQKAVWNSAGRHFSDTATSTFLVPDRLYESEAQELIGKLAQHGLLTLANRAEFICHVRDVLEKCGGNLLVAMLTLVGSDSFRNIILGEYQNLSDRAQHAYKHVALLHQHRISVPDYVLNRVTVADWNIFTNEVIRLESDLIIVQDLNYGTGRIHFAARHPEIARTIVDAVIPRYEDRIRMYRAIIGALGATEEDRKFLITLLTTSSVRDEIREQKYVEEFFEQALDLFPEDRQFLLHLGKYENYEGNLDRAQRVLKYALSLEPRDSYIVHQLGVNYQRQAQSSDNGLVRTATFQEAERLFRLKQDLDPTSHYGYASQARLHLLRSGCANDDDGRLEQLSAAIDAIQRGVSLVRDDERLALEECKAEWARAVGEPSEVVAILHPQFKSGSLRYGSSYHLLAVCLFELEHSHAAIDVIREGLTSFPGDDRLISALVSSMEPKLYDPSVRQACEELIYHRKITPANAGTVFVRNVLYYYEGNFARARHGFSELRAGLGRRAPTRIRIFYSDPQGSPVSLRCSVRRSSGARLEAKDRLTGYWLPIDNAEQWRRSGQPAEAEFHLGFSLAGFRAVIVTA